MATLEERMAFLEGRVIEYFRNLEGVREAIVSLELRMDRRLEALEQKFDHRIDSLDAKINQRIDGLDAKLSHRIDGIDAKISRQFMWLVGVQVTTLAAIVAALVAR